MNSNTSNNQMEVAKIYFEKGLQEYEKENYLFAIENYKKSLEIVPDRLSTLNNLIASFLKIGQLKSAKYYINIGLAINKNDDVLLLNEGVYNLKVKNLESALISFNKAIFVNPLYCEAYSNIGFVYELLNDSIKAMQSYNKTLDINPYFIEALYKRGNLFAKLGDNIKALSDFNRGLEINPNYQDLLACYMGSKMQVCNWESYCNDKELLKLNILKIYFFFKLKFFLQ
jgi:tetratricopeptide (TPR) repeat protein